ncbi:MAG: hypothetical protein HKO59_08420 [Phycisphaerales bacterium]|nr:hypothetical protein [Phycisphaerae bacterium]NNF44965.1 hypothetical protein [Phycisphaerales bacterium]NNM25994.1 hypothetical protein [Phycisphaerales bacterium]
MLQRTLSAALLTIVGGTGSFAVADAALPGPPADQAGLTLETLDDWQTALEPAGPALADLAVDWETTIRAGARRASAERRPLMIYVMNGHPFGCT